MRVLRSLSSLKLTLFGMLALLTGVLASYKDQEASSTWITLPLLLLALNLVAALCVNPRLYRQGGLLVFHLCLLAILLLAVFGRLTGLKGRLEIAEGQPKLVEASASIKPSTIALQEVAQDKVKCKKIKSKD